MSFSDLKKQSKLGNLTAKLVKEVEKIVEKPTEVIKEVEKPVETVIEKVKRVNVGGLRRMFSF